MIMLTVSCTHARRGGDVKFVARLPGQPESPVYVEGGNEHSMAALVHQRLRAERRACAIGRHAWPT